MVLQGQDIQLTIGENNVIVEMHLTTATGGPLILTGTLLTWKFIDQKGVTQTTKTPTVIADGTAPNAQYSVVQVELEKADTVSLNLNYTFTHELWEIKYDLTELLLSQGNITFIQGHPP